MGLQVKRSKRIVTMRKEDQSWEILLGGPCDVTNAVPQVTLTTVMGLVLVSSLHLSTLLATTPASSDLHEPLHSNQDDLRPSDRHAMLPQGKKSRSVDFRGRRGGTRSKANKERWGSFQGFEVPFGSISGRFRVESSLVSYGLQLMLL